MTTDALQKGPIFIFFSINSVKINWF